MRWDAKTDGNQVEIVEALRAVGASVTILARVGQGVPDLLVGVRGANYLVEVKLPGEDLTPAQTLWHGDWRGQVLVAHSVDEVFSFLFPGAVLSPPGPAEPKINSTERRPGTKCARRVAKKNGDTRMEYTESR